MDAEKRVRTVDHHEWTLKQPAHHTEVEKAVEVAELEQAQAAIERVRALHRNANNGTTCVYCAHGQRLGYDTEWPCDTIRALDGQEQP